MNNSRGIFEFSMAMLVFPEDFLRGNKNSHSVEEWTCVFWAVV